MDDLHITKCYVIFGQFSQITFFFFFFFTAISLFRCIVHQNDIKLKHNLKHNFFFLDCPVSPQIEYNGDKITWEQQMWLHGVSDVDVDCQVPLEIMVYQI